MSDIAADIGPLLRTDLVADPTWSEALHIAQIAAASAHEQTWFWMRMQGAFAREIELHPKLIPLLALWSDKCAGEKPPARDRFPVAELRPWLGHLALLERCDGDFLFRLCGTELIARFGGEATGKMLHTCQAPHASLRTALVHSCATGAPIASVAVAETNGDPVTWSEIVLPLWDGEQVSRLFVGSYPFQAPPR